MPIMKADKGSHLVLQSETQAAEEAQRAAEEATFVASLFAPRGIELSADGTCFVPRSHGVTPDIHGDSFSKREKEKVPQRIRVIY